MKNIFYGILLFFVIATQIGCPAPECTGKLDCACDQKKSCDDGLTCTNNKCQKSDNPGEKTPSEATEDGGSKEAPSRCDAGTKDCRCTVHDECNAGLRCEDGSCKECPEGSANCACKSGKTCNKGLKCNNGVCTGCVGEAHCPCHSNNSCDKGNRCVISSDGQSLCSSCGDKGKVDCSCQSDNDCGTPLICLNFRCAKPTALSELPKNPKCYSPCEGNVKERDGTTRLCHPTYLLMEGCLTGQTCSGGSCIAADKVGKISAQDYPTCASNANCPAWQACIQGRCYSNCTSASECSSGFGCYSYVCRRACKLDSPSCGAGNTCQNVNSTSNEGFCLPTVTRRFDTKTRTQTQAVFTLNARELATTNLNPTQVFGLTNKGKFATKVQIFRDSDTTGSKKPLSWIRFDLCKTYDGQTNQCKTFTNKPSSAEPYILDIPAGKTIIVKVSGTDKATQSGTHYEGLLRLKSTEMEQILKVGYRSGGKGRWKGRVYSFGNFEETNIDKFPASSSLDIRSIKNALLRRWINFKRNEISFDQFLAVLQSIQAKTWDEKIVKSKCKILFSTTNSDDVVCYPFSSSKGYEILSHSQREASVPSGVSSLRFAMDIKELSGHVWQGRILTDEALHYPGNPQIKLQFDAQPGSKKTMFLRSLDAVVDLGGRYYVSDKESCENATDFQKKTMPWLISGFLAGTYERPGSLFRNRFECRSQVAPQSIPAGATKEAKEKIFASNISLSAANPIPNGRTLRRTVSLVDGVLYDNRIFFALIKERFTSPFSSSSNSNLSKDWVRYGYLQLNYVAAELTDKDFQGSTPKVCSGQCGNGETCEKGICQPKNKLKQVSCDPAIILAATNRPNTSLAQLRLWSKEDLKSLVSTLLGEQSTAVTNDATLQIKRGTSTNGGVEYAYTRDGAKRYIHYYCADTKQFNGGPTDNPKDCPADSKIYFFEHTIEEANMRGHSCQKSGTANTCDKTFSQLSTSADFRADVPYKCIDANAVYCTKNFKDLREGKVFFKKTSNATKFVSKLAPLRNALFEAFRYRVKFRSRSGKTIGFAPQICSKSLGSQIPYCYSPEVIEELEQRVNCLEAMFSDKVVSNRMYKQTKATIKGFLQHTFSFSNRNINGVLFTDPGFETLNAELKVMLGDEAYTKALTSRYDLAGSNLLTFEGDEIEPNGVRLSGILGYEMHQLHLSVHYYQSVVDRFFSQTDTFVISFASSSTSFLTAASVTSYMKKLLLAATRKARSWSQIAKNYHKINRSDLAKHVLERAYLSSYLEQLVLTQLLHKLLNILDNRQIAQLRKEIEQATLTYNSALLDMQESHIKVQQQLNFFGFADGYIPFPALSRSAIAANPLDSLRTVLRTAKEKLAIARAKEELALQSTRSFDTNSARFQSELVKLETNYNEQLIGLCGELKDGDQSVPAIPRYAHLQTGKVLANPCGTVKGSQIYNAFLTLERVALDVPQLQQQKKNLDSRIENEKLRIQKFCNDRFSLAQITWKHQNKVKDMLLRKDTDDLILQAAMRVSMGLAQIKMSHECYPLLGATQDVTTCVSSTFSTASRLAILFTQEAAVTAIGVRINDVKKELLSQQRDFAKVQVQVPCNICPPDKPNCNTPGTSRIQSTNYLAQLALEQTTFRLRMLNAQYNMRITFSRLQSLQNKAKRLIQQQKEALAKKLEVAAAASDPNQRIYKNDAVVTAERTFTEALQQAYRLTLLYEYYTNKTYERKGNLYLIRMITKGDVNLETYLSRLEQAYRDFEEGAGKPVLRVLVLSLRDDIIKTPRTKPDGTAFGLQERVNAFQKLLRDPKYHNELGYLSFPFAISVAPKYSLVSPVTYGHKVIYAEAEIKATERGDDVGRIYLQQLGTGMVREADDQIKYYSLPSRTGVLNTFFNGHKVYAPSIYQNFRFQDRPLGNTQWSLSFNQVSEKSNQDIELNSINDIILYIYYRDFSK